MPSSSIAFNKFGREIVFEETSHSYYIDDPSGRIKFTSVTSFISRFFPKFEAEKIAPFTANKRGISVQEVLDEWERAGKESREFGTRVHACCEDTLLGQDLRYHPTNEKERRTYANAIKAATIIKSRYDIVGVEKLIFDEKLKLSGTIDLLIRSRNEPLKYCIVDWKTNKEIDTFSKYNKFAFAPISDLQNCTMSHYGLQTGIYGHILKSGFYVPENSILKYMLVHVTEEQAKFIPVSGYETHVEKLLETIR